MGLPYAADAAITRHLARFLRSRRAGEHEVGAAERPRVPHAYAFQRRRAACAVRARSSSTVLNGWLQEEGAPEGSAGEDLMHAVARGSAYYGAARHGKGVRIRGGIARSYYVGIETAMPAVPGIPAPLKALSVAQFGMEEGTSIQIPEREFGLIVGDPAEFRFFCSSARKNDTPGTLIEDFGDDLEELSPVEVRLIPRQLRRTRPRIFRNRDHRNRYPAALVRRPRRPPLETGIQRPRTVNERRHRSWNNQLRPRLD